jgi:hypothetical protein
VTGRLLALFIGLDIRQLVGVFFKNFRLKNLKKCRYNCMFGLNEISIVMKEAKFSKYNFEYTLKSAFRLLFIGGGVSVIDI